MARDPKTSVLNAFNQIHTCKNVFIMDRAYMPLSARAVAYAVDELKKGNL